MVNIQSANQVNGTKKSGGGRCCLFGCMIVAVLLIILLIGGYHGARYLVHAYTQETAVEIPKVEMSQEELNEVQSRWNNFKTDAENGKAVRIELTARDANALIANNPDWQKLKGGIYLEFGNAEVSGLISIDLSDMGAMAKGRYLNGYGTFNVSCENGRLKIFAKNVEIAGTPLSENVMNGVRTTDLAEGIYTDTDEDSRKLAERLKRVKSMEFRPDLMIIDVE